MRRLLLIVALCFSALVAVQPAPARAHAVLLETIPAENAILDEPPAEVALRFNEPVDLLPDSLTTLDPSGNRVDLGDAGRGDSAEWARVSLPPELPDGTYLVSWGVISADGHPIRGAFVFHIGAPSADPPVPPSTETPAWVDPYASTVRAFEYIAVLGALGIAMFLVLVHDGHATERRRLRAGVAALTWVALVTIPFAILAESLRVSGATPSDALAWDQLRVIIESGPGLAAVILAAGALAVLTVFYVMGRSAIVSLLPGAAVMVAASAWRGHSAAIDPEWFGLIANAVHMAAAATWFGGLAALGFVAWTRHRHGHDGIRKQLSRFSRVALIAFLIVAVTGIALGFRILPSTGALFDTRYGNLLLAKSALVAVVLVIAAYHRFRVLRRPRVGSGVRFTVVAEVVLMVGIVAVTAALVMRDPNVAEYSSQAPDGYVSEGFVGDFHFDLRVNPASTGENSIELDFHGFEGADPASIQRVQLHLVEPERDIGPFTIEVEPRAPGVYRYTGAEMQVAGTWELTVAVRLSDFQEERLSYEVPIE